jgi:hypothetical protein
MKHPLTTYNSEFGVEVYKALEKLIESASSGESELSRQELIKALRRLYPDANNFTEGMIAASAAPKLGTAMSLSDVINVEGKTPAQAARDHVESYGIEFAPQNKTISSILSTDKTPPIFESIRVPLSKLRMENVRELFFAVQPLDNFFKQNIVDEKYLKNTKLSIAATPEEFAKKFYELHPDQVGQITPEEIKNNTVGFNVKSGANGKREIVVNLQLTKDREDTSAFGGNLLTETIAHEYAHSVQQNMSPTWGQEGDQATEEYRSIFESDPNISNYSDKNISEHFAENFARYVISGEASPEFVEYLKSKQIEKIDSSNLMHPLMRSDMKTDLENLLNTDDSPVMFRVSVENPSVSESEAVSRFKQTGVPNLINRRPVTLEIIAKDPAQFGGQTFLKGGNGVFQTDENGNLSISGDLLSIADSAQGQGIGSAFLQKMSQYIALNGGGKINMTAGLQNGPYMWAISGFDFANSSEATKFIRLAEDMLPLASLWKQNQDKLNALSLDQKRLMYRAVSEYPRAAEELLSQLTPDQAEIIRAFRAYISKYRHTNDVKKSFLMYALENGFNITEEDLEQLSKLSMASPSSVMPAYFANIGRKTKPESAVTLSDGTPKKSSSLGRAIMMTGGHWQGFLNIPAVSRGN